MIRTVMRIAWLNLVRDRAALVLTFMLPLIFFSIFAMIFSGMGSSGPSVSRPLKIIALDLDGSEISRRFVRALDEQEGLTVTTELRDTDGTVRALDRATARQEVREGRFEALVVVPEQFGAEFGRFDLETAPVEVLYNAANPMAQFAVTGLIQAAAFTAAPDVLMERGMEQLDEFGGGLTPMQRQAIDTFRRLLREEAGGGMIGGGDADAGGGFAGLVTVKASDARADEQRRNRGPSIVAYFAAGIGVMFLLFSMAGSAGSILEEEEAGTLERLLMSSASLGTLLGGKWLFYAAVGVVQLTLMFIWGSVMHGLDLWVVNHIAGFLVVTLFTALAASAFGLFLATICRSRAQLSGVSTVVILIMSALGGSMVPRFVMPDSMAAFGRFTFNGWAIEGYHQVFWNNNPDDTLVQSLARLALPVIVLAGMTVVFLIAARLAARKWETI